MQFTLNELKQIIAEIDDPKVIELVAREIRKLEDADERKQVDWNLAAEAIGMQRDQLGKKFKYGSELYEITGINLSSRKYPVQAKRLPDGKPYKFPVSIARTAA